MKHELIEELLRGQLDCVAVWQLHDEEWTRKAVRARLRSAGLRKVLGADGVWTATRARLSERQRWMAAALTAPDTFVHHHSATRLWGFGDTRKPEPFVSVVRRGNGGPRRHGGVLVRHARDVSSNGVTRRFGIPVTTAARTLVDVAGVLADVELRRAVLEALRLDTTTHDQIAAERARRPKAKGAGRLRVLLESIEGLPVARRRSNSG